MNELPHLRLEGTAKPEPYTYAGPVPSGLTFERPIRNPSTHARKVRKELEQADADARRRRAEDAEAHHELVEWHPKGVVLTFRSDPDHELNLKRLERDGAGIQLLGVIVDAGVQTARVFVPEGRLTEFLKLVDAYAASIVLTYVAEPNDEAKLKGLADPERGIEFRAPVRPTKDKKKVKLKFIVAEAEVDGFKKKVGTIATLFSEDRQHGELIDSIAAVRLAIVEDFWQDRLQFPSSDENIWWEVWLRGKRATASEVHRRFAELARIVGISMVSNRFVAFPERVVVHARAMARQFSSSVDLMALIGELRKGKELATHYVDLDAKGQAEFVDDVAVRLVLSLLTTIMRPDRLLTTTRDTSPATALAARMAAVVWSHYPRLWPETVRALLVHSAKWTPAMKKRFPDDKKSNVLCLTRPAFRCHTTDRGDRRLQAANLQGILGELK